MAKNFDPFVLLMMPEPSPTTVVGGGTGQSTTDPYAVDYNDWFTMYGGDVDGDGDTDFDDYRLWFSSTFGEEADELWGLFNDASMTPGAPFPDWWPQEP